MIHRARASRKSAVLLEEEDRDASSSSPYELTWWAWLYYGLLLALVIAAVVLISITLADLIMFHNKVKDAVHKYNFDKLTHLDFHPEKITASLNLLIKLAQKIYEEGDYGGGGGGHGSGSGSGSGSGDDDCYKPCHPRTETHAYRPYETGLLQQPYQRYRKGNSEVYVDPSPRLISSSLMGYEPGWSMNEDTCAIKPNRKGLSAWVWGWGQFIDHTLVLTEAGEQFGVMEVDISCDPVADPQCSGKKMHMTRSKYVLDKQGVRQPVNQLSPYLSATNVYGDTYERYHELRSYEGGGLKTSKGNFMPFNEHGLPNAGGDGRTDLFLGGDVRANEQLTLTCIHTLWVREHNAWAHHLKEEHPDWGEEQLYWSARRIVTAEMQAITYKEFLPALLGKAADPSQHDANRKYSMPPPRYDSSLKPGIHNEFGAAGFRFGHSMVSESLLLYNSKTHSKQCLPLRQVFFNPSAFHEHGLDPVLAGMGKQPAEELDLAIVDSLRNFLHFAEFIDLASLNIMRGRDHGLPYYHELYYSVHGKFIKGWDDITSSKPLQAKLKQVYNDWKHMDVFVGLLAEDPVEDSSLGSTATLLLLNEFQHIRDSDPYYYEWDEGLSEEQREIVSHTKLSDIIVRNTELSREEVQANVFIVA